MIPYTPVYKPNQVICGTGQTAVITGWTVMKTVAKKLDPKEYAVIGQLYSPTRGISVLVRNLIANPHVRHLVAINATKEDKNAGGCDCLLDFFNNGFEKGVSDTGRECWIIKSSIVGYIDIEIEQEVLEKLRLSMTVWEATSLKQGIETVKAIAQTDHRVPWGEPKLFPSLEFVPTTLPGARYGHRIEGRTIAETWVKIIQRIKTTGTIRPTGYDGQWQELIDLIAIVTDEPPDFYFPEPNYLPCDRSFMNEYMSQILEDAPYQEGVKYTYGQRLRSWFKKDQVEQVIQKLIGEIDAASAVMSLWDVNDHEMGGSPCLNHIWIRVVNEELSLTAVFRSNDMFSAWPANAMGLRALQQHIRDEIAVRSIYDLKMGPLITLSESAHIYDDCHHYADHLIKEQYEKICRDRTYDDPCGNFLIESKGKLVVVQQTSSGSGEVVAHYGGHDPLQLARDICRANPGIQAEHSAYLAIELQKAVSLGVNYIQDRS
jgi:thymidylate synthase